MVKILQLKLTKGGNFTTENNKRGENFAAEINKR